MVESCLLGINFLADPIRPKEKPEQGCSRFTYLDARRMVTDVLDNPELVLVLIHEERTGREPTDGFVIHAGIPELRDPTFNRERIIEALTAHVKSADLLLRGTIKVEAQAQPTSF